MHNHIHIMGIEVPVCLEEVKTAASILPFASYYWWLTKVLAKGLWARLRRM